LVKAAGKIVGTFIAQPHSPRRDEVDLGSDFEM
jgi:hypothetical protein